jgi:aspartate racemase
MRTLGLLGGMAWPSTLEAYRAINAGVAEHLGGNHSAPLLVWSADFAEVERLQSAGAWEAAGAMLADAAQRLEAAGAEGLLLCSNTMHRVAGAIEAAVAVPLLHIADVTAQAVRADDLSRVGLLGTRFTMEDDLYRRRLADHGLEVLVPDAPDRDVVHRVIYEELVRGRTSSRSRQEYLRIIARLLDRGAEGVIAGCTEIELLVTAEDVPVAYYPTTRLHADAAVAWIVQGRSEPDGDL